MTSTRSRRWFWRRYLLVGLALIIAYCSNWNPYLRVATLVLGSMLLAVYVSDDWVLRRRQERREEKEFRRMMRVTAAEIQRRGEP